LNNFLLSHKIRFMSGHSKWSKIKRKKGAADAKRSQMFSRVIKEITVSVREGNSDDPDFNPRLRLAISNAKGVNMPKENIERAIKKAMDFSGQAFHTPTYDGDGPGGRANFVECATDNLNRTISSVRSIFSKHGGNLSTSGSVDFLFERKGVFILNPKDFDRETLELELIDGGAEDIEYDDDSKEMTVTVNFEDFGKMQKKLDDLHIRLLNTSIERIPLSTTVVSLEEAKKVINLIESLESDDDVQNVFHNLEMTDELEVVLTDSPSPF
jgi:YebC/PmpR family DNA-binding regulatory protein